MFQFRTVVRGYNTARMYAAGDLGQCTLNEYVFRVLSSPRAHARRQRPLTTASQEDIMDVDETSDPRSDSAGVEEECEHLRVIDMAGRHDIIARWEEAMSTHILKEIVCSVCGCATDRTRIVVVDPVSINLSVLRNSMLPEHLQPRTYNRIAYQGAILHPQGLVNTLRLDSMHICVGCLPELKRGRLPKFALANWLYFGHEHLPATVREAFQTATPVERMLISRARASKISFKFSESKDATERRLPSEISQRYVKGNIAIHPQDSTHLTDVLPPSTDMIRDTVCAVFVGQTRPTKASIERLRPVLVRKSRVQTMIEFLVANNPHYRVDGTFKGLSLANLDGLFGPGTSTVDQGVPCSIEIGHIERSDAVSGATDGYIPGDAAAETNPRNGTEDVDMLMENVGYTDNDDTPVNYQQMSMAALAHCLKRGAFIRSQAGSQFIPDFENPSLLSWLFPHLDPWGIGGFFDPRRLVPLTLPHQLKYLLRIESSMFRKDADFAFVYYNILQKRAVFDSVTFRVPASQRERVIHELLNVDVTKLDKLIAAYKENPRYRAQDQDEAAIVRLLLKVNTMAHDLPGGNGYKIALRNQIRGLINHIGTPTLFITLNPSDRDHPLVRLYGGEDINVEDAARGEEWSRWQRTVFAAANPAACARFFDTMISNFIRIVLGYEGAGKGLFG
ncbi:hypothetical protein C2E23DRAFT_913766, partial [Lenzites betulinus]